ncbi:hypothetical protein [Cellulomonas carbonis]|uniref:hypothetical protein n=1 Tax=Cellulomonas carbonis TaxID=1386092 RepID=UPI000B019540|nr:hypothetical protein [Cellulomonas carbonis]
MTATAPVPARGGPAAGTQDPLERELRRMALIQRRAVLRRSRRRPRTRLTGSGA